MRFVFLAILLITLPLIIGYARKGERQRDHLMLLLGLLVMAVGTLAMDAAIISWPVWPGTSRGVIVSFVDTIALALVMTRKQRTRVPHLLGLMALFLITMLPASALSGTKMASLFSLFQFAQLVFLYYAIVPELERESGLQNLFKGIALGLMIQAGVVIQQKLTGVVQAYGTTVHQNILGLMLHVSVLPLIAYVLEGYRSKLIYAGIVAGLICIAAGGSRGSVAFFAGALVLLVLLSLIRRSSGRKWGFVGLGVLGAAILVPVTMGTFTQRFGDREIASGDKTRDDLERAARFIAADHPLGVGPNTFVTINNMGGYATRAGMDWGAGTLDKPVHNAYLLARAETGWAGQIALFLLMGGTVFLGLRTGFRCRTLPLVGVSLGGACGIIAVALHSNYEFAWYTLDVQRLFFIDAALIAAATGVAIRTEKANRNEGRLRAAARHDPAARGLETAVDGGRAGI